MNWLDERALLALANLAVCSAIGWICVCRVAVMSKGTTRGLTRLAYIAVFFAATCSGWQRPLFRDWPGYADLAMSLALLVYMASTTRAWRFGLPEFAKSGPAPLHTEKEHDR